MSRTDRKLKYHMKKPSKPDASKQLSPVNYESHISDPHSFKNKQLKLTIPNSEEFEHAEATVKHTVNDMFLTSSLHDYCGSESKAEAINALKHASPASYQLAKERLEQTLSNSLQYFSRSVGLDYSNQRLNDDLVHRCLSLERKVGHYEEKLARLNKKYNDIKDREPQTSAYDGQNFMQLLSKYVENEKRLDKMSEENRRLKKELKKMRDSKCHSNQGI